MNDFSFLARGVGVPELADPADLYAKQMTLAQIARTAQIQQMQMEQARRAQSSSEGVGQGLGLLRDPTNDEEVYGVLQKLPPEARAAFVSEVQKARKARGDYQGDLAKTDETRTKTAAQKLEIVGGVAGALAQAPTRENMMMAQQRLAAAGIDPSLLALPQGADPVAHYGQLAQSTIKAKEQAELADKAQQRGLTARGQDITMRGQDQTAATALAGQGVTRRGQDIGASTARRGQDLTNARSIDSTAATRDAAGGAKLNSETQAYAKFIESNALPNLTTSANALDATLKKYAGKNIPGVGPVESRIPTILQSGEGKAVRAQLQAMSNDLLKLYSGGAVTLNEAERRTVEMMASGDFTDADLMTAWPLVKGRIDAAQKNARGGFSPEAIKTYEERGGLKLRPIGEAQEAKPEAPASGEQSAGKVLAADLPSPPDPAKFTGKRMLAPDGKTWYRSNGRDWKRD